jgi:hypothetical protein
VLLKERGGALRYNPATLMYSFREPRHYLAAKKLLKERPMIFSPDEMST